MPLVRLVYASRKTEVFNHGELAAIMRVSIRNNLAHNLTGLLLVGEECCLQCLEGERKAVNQLYQKLLQDERHQELEVLDYIEIDARYFSQWPMRLRYTSNPVAVAAAQPVFDPYALDRAGLHALLQQMGAHPHPQPHPLPADTQQPGIKSARGFFSWM